MQFLIIVLLLCMVISLFFLYLSTKEDFYFSRKNISMDIIFNTAIITSVVSLFFARFFYILLNPDPVFLNPLVFVLFPYFPGLSILGGLIGGVSFLFLFAKYNNLPFLRISDFFSLSLLSALPVGIICLLIILRTDYLSHFIQLLLSVVALTLTLVIILPRLQTRRIKDGIITSAFLMCFPIFYALGYLLKGEITLFLSAPVLILCGLIILMGISIIIRQLIGRKKSE